MAGAGDLDLLGMQWPRMQLLTVPEILDRERSATAGPTVVRPSSGCLVRSDWQQATA